MLYGTTANLKMNLKMLLDLVFLKDGHFRNINVGNLIYGIDASRLLYSEAGSNEFGGVSGCQVWQSPFQQWVFESGITLNNVPYISSLTPPIVCSGILVNGTFFVGSVSGNQYFIDFDNGRIIFNGAGIPTTSDVKAAYSFKNFRISYKMSDARKDIQAFSELYLKDNPYDGIRTLTYPSGYSGQINTFPAIYLQFANEDFEAYELGNPSQTENHTIFCHILSMNDWDLTTARDLLKSRIRNTFMLIDFNYAPLPLSGITNSISPAYMPYQTLQTNPVYNSNSVAWGIYSFEDGRYRDDDLSDNQISDAFFKGVFRYDIKIYNQSPNGRVGNNPYIP